jgi:hypothetical protein
VKKPKQKKKNKKPSLVESFEKEEAMVNGSRWFG